MLRSECARARAQGKEGSTFPMTEPRKQNFRSLRDRDLGSEVAPTAICWFTFQNTLYPCIFS